MGCTYTCNRKNVQDHLLSCSFSGITKEQDLEARQLTKQAVILECEEERVRRQKHLSNGSGYWSERSERSECSERSGRSERSERSERSVSRLGSPGGDENALDGPHTPRTPRTPRTQNTLNTPRTPRSPRLSRTPRRPVSPTLTKRSKSSPTTPHTPKSSSTSPLPPKRFTSPRWEGRGKGGSSVGGKRSSRGSNPLSLSNSQSLHHLLRSQVQSVVARCVSVMSSCLFISIYVCIYETVSVI